MEAAGDEQVAETDEMAQLLGAQLAVHEEHVLAGHQQVVDPGAQREVVVVGLLGARAHAVRHQQHLLPVPAQALDKRDHLADVVVAARLDLLLQHDGGAHAHHLAVLEEAQVHAGLPQPLLLGAVHLEGEGVVGARDEVGQAQALGELVRDAAAGDEGLRLGQEDLRDDPVDRVLEGTHRLGALEHRGVQVQRREDRGDVVQQELLATVGEGDAALVQQHVAVRQSTDRRVAAQQGPQRGQQPVREREGVDGDAEGLRVRGDDLEVRVRILGPVLRGVHAQQGDVDLAETLAEGLHGALEHRGGALVAGQRGADDGDAGGAHGRISWGMVRRMTR